VTVVKQKLYTLENQAKARLYYLLRSNLSQSQRTAMKKMLADSRKRFRKLHLLRYGHFTAKELVDELRRRINFDFDILMVHSAYDRLLPMYSGTPKQLISELIGFCGEKRTLAMPAFFLGGRRYNALEYYKSNAFDVRGTISEMGLLTEVFRRTPEVKRSLHPTHSICAIGPLADELTATHHLGKTRTGRATPFELMAQKRTVILGLGVEYYRCLTQTHSAEDLLGDEFPIEFSKETITVRLIDSEKAEMPYQLTVLRSSKTLDNMLVRSLLSPEELVEWSFRGVAMFFTLAHRVTECLVDAARRGVTVFRG
jgi:aminoglycoside 3-N-acetyltransferase